MTVNLVCYAHCSMFSRKWERNKEKNTGRRAPFDRDDHSKNFAYLYQESARLWRLSPAYDLTFSNTYYGEHTTTVDGNGKDPGLSELVAVGTGAGMSRQTCRRIAEEIRECVYEKLGEYL